MKAGEFPNDRLTEQEFAALCEMIKGKTINEAAPILMRKFGISFSQTKRRRHTAFEKLGLLTGNQTEAALKAVYLGLVSFEDVARYYGFPMFQSTEKRRLSGAVNHSFLSEVDVGNPEEVNSWLAEAVVTRTRRPAHGDRRKLYTSLSQLLSKARTHAITYPPHPLSFKTHPYYGFYPSFSNAFYSTLMQTYEMDGPRLLFMGGPGSGTFPMAVADELTKDITTKGNDKALLTQAMLDNRRQYQVAFRAQASQWLHLDICPMRAIERFICHGETARDDWLPYLGVNPIEPDHVKQWLHNVLGHLFDYEDTYHLALLNDRKYPDNPVVKSIWQDFWAVKVPVNGKRSILGRMAG
jgi:hypothetical protein